METHLEIERKFLVREATLSDLKDLQLSVIHSVYLDPEELDVADVGALLGDTSNDDDEPVEIRISAVATGEGSENVKYWATSKLGAHDLSRVEAITEIKKSMFDAVKTQYGRKEIKKSRFTFKYLRKVFELDVINNGDTLILEVELDDENQLFAVPPFVDIIREVTGDSDYYSHSLATEIA